MNRRANHNRKTRIINLLYRWSKSLSSSVKNRYDKHTHIPKMKNQNKSYFALSVNALIHTCCRHTAKSRNTIIVATKISRNCTINLDSVFFNSIFQVILSVCSLFFIALIRHLKFVKTYRSNIITKVRSINSFHIRNSVRNWPSRPNLKVTKVCKKNCNKSHITNILHNKPTRNLKSLEQILDHRDVNLFIIKQKKT